MATYKFGKYQHSYCIDYFAIHKKKLFGWSEKKRWNLTLYNSETDSFEEPTEEFEEQQREKMMESVERLVRGGHTVI